MSTADEHRAWVRSTARVRAEWGWPVGSRRAEGTVRAYSEAPMVLIETDSGERVWWRADMCRAADTQTEPTDTVED